MLLKASSTRLLGTSSTLSRTNVISKATFTCLEAPAVVQPSRPQQQQQQQQRQQQQQQEHTQQQLVQQRRRRRLKVAVEQPPVAQLPQHMRLPGADQDMSGTSSASVASAWLQQEDCCHDSTSAPQKRRRRRASSSRSSADAHSSSSRKRRWTHLHSRLLQTLRSQQLLPQHARVLVAVSGGQDSMALLVLLHDLSQQQHWPLQLVVGHCDHRVRPDSADNAIHVMRCCQQLGLPYLQAQADRDQGHWAEAAARDWRHQQLLRMAVAEGCTHLALGHTATERAETVLFNMIRGAGLHGLGAMGWSRALPEGDGPCQGPLTLVRPLLDLSRPDTLQACQLTGTQIYVDSTNDDPRYIRNRLRQQVFPLLHSINPSAVRHICGAAELLRSEGQLLDQLAREALAEATAPCHLAPAPASSRQQLSPPPPQQQGQEPQQQQQQEQQERDPEGSKSLFLDGLWLPVLSAMHPALAARVVLLWLSQHTSRSVGQARTRQVLRLLQPGQGSGARTSTLWGSSCVLRYQQLLLVLDAEAVRKVQAGQLLVQRVTVPGAAAARQSELLREGADICFFNGLVPSLAALDDTQQQQQDPAHEQPRPRVLPLVPVPGSNVAHSL